MCIRDRDWVVDYLYTLKLRARIELEYNQLKTENEQLVYAAMLAEEMQHKLTVYENLYDEISVNEMCIRDSSSAMRGS